LIEPISPAELKAWLEDSSREAPVFIDVREAWEHEHVNVEQALHMPMQMIPARLAELDPQRPHVLMCHHGMRSYRVAEFLEDKGFDRLYNLSGGIDAWAEDVAPGLKRY
jgi:rhodanese-related sulfurtransferase